MMRLLSSCLADCIFQGRILWGGSGRGEEDPEASGHQVHPKEGTGGQGEQHWKWDCCPAQVKYTTFFTFSERVSQPAKRRFCVRKKIHTLRPMSEAHVKHSGVCRGNVNNFITGRTHASVCELFSEQSSPEICEMRSVLNSPSAMTLSQEHSPSFMNGRCVPRVLSGRAVTINGAWRFRTMPPLYRTRRQLRKSGEHFLPFQCAILLFG